jgi:hypothetical protein
MQCQSLANSFLKKLIYLATKHGIPFPPIPMNRLKNSLPVLPKSCHQAMSIDHLACHAHCTTLAMGYIKAVIVVMHKSFLLVSNYRNQ